MMIPPSEAAAPAAAAPVAAAALPRPPSVTSKPRVILPPAISGSSETLDKEPEAAAPVAAATTESSGVSGSSETDELDWGEDAGWGDWGEDDEADWEDDGRVAAEPSPSAAEPAPSSAAELAPAEPLNTGQRSVFGFSPDDFIDQTSPVNPIPERDLPGIEEQSEPIDEDDLPGIYTQYDGLDEASVAEDASEEAFLESDPDRSFDVGHIYEDDAYPEAKSSRNVVIPLVVVIGLLIFGGVAALVSSDLGRDVDAEGEAGVASTELSDTPAASDSAPAKDSAVAPPLAATDDASSIRGLAGGEPDEAEADPESSEGDAAEADAPKDGAKPKKTTRRKVKKPRKKPKLLSLDDADLPPRRVDPKEAAPDPKPAKKPKKVEDKLQKELDWLKQR